MFSYDGPLGANATEDGVALHVWAPTAQVCSSVPFYKIQWFLEVHILLTLSWM